MYEISYVHQIIAFFVAALGDIMHDALMANLMGLLCCQLELLMNRIQNLASQVKNALNDVSKLHFIIHIKFVK